MPYFVAALNNAALLVLVSLTANPSTIASGGSSTLTWSSTNATSCTASGGWSGKSLILVRGSLRGNARHVYEVVDNDNYTMKIQFSPDAEGWADVLTGVYRRIH